MSGIRRSLSRRRNDDRINTSFTYGFVFDMCGIEIDPVTYQVKRRPLCVDARRRQDPQSDDRHGQFLGAFAQGIAAALYEEFVTNEEGAFLTGTFADYLVPTVSEIPTVQLLPPSRPRRSRRSAPRIWPKATA